MISPKDGKSLVELAKNSINLYFEGKTPDLKPYSKFNIEHGVFVTLYKKGKLRGCVGFPLPYYPLNEAIIKAAIAAAFEDTRFFPLTKEELKDTEVEVSILTVPKKIIVSKYEEYLKKIKIGTDGLIVKTKFTQGLLLPQVATEWNFTPIEFLEATCEKANLPRSSWKEKEVEILKFQTQIFKDEK